MESRSKYRNMYSRTRMPLPTNAVYGNVTTCHIILQNMQLVLVPKNQYGTFYEGDSYLIYAASEFGKFVGPRSKVSVSVVQRNPYLIHE